MSNSSVGQISRSILRISSRGQETRADALAIEEPLEIAIRHRARRRVAAITMRTPGRDLDLALGFLFSEGLLPQGINPGDGAQVESNSLTLEWPNELELNLRSLDRHTYTSSSCGVCGKTSIEQVYQSLPFPDDPSAWRVEASTIYPLPDRLREAQSLFRTTGGIHAAGIFTTTGELLHVAEDVGRHNALDKVVGHGYRQGLLPLHRTILILSGRASFELIQKAAMAGIGLVASVGAPSSLAVELAEDNGITLCGFVRPHSLNCYTHAERIVA
ncbi:formate dehydrogenase accessory sulfurtransferase FdhD [Lewinella sp. IMCC34191]|uniref:formate dehydrogenase accessory sulfurtransferase FdhD n=1 Tax=Lewinella sp. IMCC34191 TaxID=2259172 RepID=UPI000E275E6C|nr:formate dehydrogenase accessory sulfurtransferase FdhD [Lewinella sp. IMCC34191]